MVMTVLVKGNPPSNGLAWVNDNMAHLAELCTTETILLCKDFDVFRTGRAADGSTVL